MTSVDRPFVLRGGSDEQTALHNRIAAIERIKFLSGTDLRKKSVDYLRALDLEMWHRWYKNDKPDAKIDENFCQRATVVIREMEGGDKPVNEEGFARAFNQHIIDLKREPHVDREPENNQETTGQTDEPDKN